MTNYNDRKDIDYLLRTLTALVNDLNEKGVTNISELLNNYYDQSEVDGSIIKIDEDISSVQKDISPLTDPANNKIIMYNGEPSLSEVDRINEYFGSLIGNLKYAHFDNAVHELVNNEWEIVTPFYHQADDIIGVSVQAPSGRLSGNEDFHTVFCTTDEKYYIVYYDPQYEGLLGYYGEWVQSPERPDFHGQNQFYEDISNEFSKKNHTHILNDVTDVDNSWHTYTLHDSKNNDAEITSATFKVNSFIQLCHLHYVRVFSAGDANKFYYWHDIKEFESGQDLEEFAPLKQPMGSFNYAGSLMVYPNNGKFTITGHLAHSWATPRTLIGDVYWYYGDTSTDYIYYHLSTISETSSYTSGDHSSACGENIDLILPYSFELSFDFKTSISGCRFNLCKNTSVGNNPNYSMYFGVGSTGYFEYGVRTTSTDTYSTSATNDGEYHNFKIVREGDTLTYYIDGLRHSTTKTATWIDNYNYTFYWSYWRKGDMYVKNIKIKPLQGD